MLFYVVSHPDVDTWKNKRQNVGLLSCLHPLMPNPNVFNQEQQLCHTVIILLEGIMFFMIFFFNIFFLPPIYFQLECQCQELHTEQHVTQVENVRLKQTNDELARELEHVGQELTLTQEQLSLLQEQSTRLHEEKEM